MTLPNSEHSVTIATEVTLLSASEQAELLREQVDSLHQMVEQLNLALLDKQRQIEELEQELAQTNRELCNALAVKEPEIGKLQQSDRQEKPTSKSLDRWIEANCESVFLTNEPEIAEFKRNTPLNLLAKQASKNSKEAIARSKQLQAQYNEFGVQYVSLRANFDRFGELIVQTVTHLHQSKDESIIHPLKENRQKHQENLKQLKAHRAKSTELLKDSEKSLKRTKLELTKLHKSNKNIKKVDFCFAKIDLSNPA